MAAARVRVCECGGTQCGNVFLYVLAIIMLIKQTKTN